MPTSGASLPSGQTPLAAVLDFPCGRAWGHCGDFAGFVTNAYSSVDGQRQVVLFLNDDTPTPRAARLMNELLTEAYCA